MLKTKNLQNVPPGQPERATELFVPASVYEKNYSKLKNAAGLLAFQPALQELLEKLQAERREREKGRGDKS